jgi:hypothetical protein
MGRRPRVSAARESRPSRAPARICVRESEESRPLEGAAPHRPPSTVGESGEDATCRCRSSVRESAEDATRLYSYEIERDREDNVCVSEVPCVGIIMNGQQHVSSLEILSCSSVCRLLSPKFGPRAVLSLRAHAAPKI